MEFSLKPSTRKVRLLELVVRWISLRENQKCVLFIFSTDDADKFLYISSFGTK